MGSTETFESSNLGKELTAEELSSEVLNKLKSFAYKYYYFLEKSSALV